MSRLRIALASFLVFLGIVAADVNFNESRAVLKAVASASFANATFSNPTFTGTVTASQVTGIPVVLAKWGVPCILASSGTMGNNGAVSGMTALPTTYSGGAWLYLPANAIEAGSAAGFYWFVASSSTAGTVYNSTFNGASVPALGTTTAFATTGPGAFTGVASGTEITAATVAIGADHMGPNGELLINIMAANNTAAGNKTPRIKLGGTTFYTNNFSTSSTAVILTSIRNGGVAAINKAWSWMTTGTSPTATSITYGSENTANALNLTVTLEKATATNHLILEGGTVTLVYGS